MLDFFKKQFIDVIEWLESEDGVLAYRYPMQDQEIQTGAQLTVRESQLALFVNEGRIADVFQPGRHKLSTSTLPILTNLMNWDKQFQSPFKSDVYYFSTREQLDQRWGTPAPVTVRDKDSGPIRIRANGTYAFHIADPATFHTKISGTRDTYRVDALDDQLRAVILTAMATHFGQANVAFLGMAANQLLFSEAVKAQVAPAFADYGLELSAFMVQSITLPEELQAYLDKATSMNMLGDLPRYTQFQAAESIPLAAQNEGGLAGAGVGLGAGVAMGQAFAQAFQGSMPGTTTAGASSESTDDVFETIDKLHGLLEKGVLTQTEFDAKKAELLKKI